MRWTSSFLFLCTLCQIFKCQYSYFIKRIYYFPSIYAPGQFEKHLDYLKLPVKTLGPGTFFIFDGGDSGERPFLFFFKK